MTALLIVDIQNDFIPSGALSVPEGDLVIPVINQLTEKGFDIIVASKDWHPKDHGSFANTQKKQVGDHIVLNGLDQILWPDHCVQGTIGADFSPDLNTDKIDHVTFKGTNRNVDSYSAFFDNGHLHSTELHEVLKKEKITDIYICGLATDYCVKFSALDAINLGYNTYVIIDACRGVNLSDDDTEKAIQEMREAGAHIITSSDVMTPC